MSKNDARARVRIARLFDDLGKTISGLARDIHEGATQPDIDHARAEVRNACCTLGEAVAEALGEPWPGS